MAADRGAACPGVAEDGPADGTGNASEHFQPCESGIDGKVDRFVQLHARPGAEENAVDVATGQMGGDDRQAGDSPVADDAVGRRSEDGHRHMLFVRPGKRGTDVMEILAIQSVVRPSTGMHRTVGIQVEILEEQFGYVDFFPRRKYIGFHTVSIPCRLEGWQSSEGAEYEYTCL